MAPAKIQITAAGTPLTPCASSPQLMPFHIAYSGPAPITTFFRVREMNEESPTSSASASSSSPGSSDITVEEKSAANDGVHAGKKSMVNGNGKLSLGKRLVAAFRGRRVVGVEVPLPEGYTGVILHFDAASAKKTDPQGSLSNGVEGSRRMNGRRKASMRGTRHSKPIEVDDDEDVSESSPNQNGIDLNDDMTDPSLILNSNEHEGEVKALKAMQTFQSIVVWNPDVVVDDGRDEYIQALREWTAVASEVHRMED
ncbi:hypothetical protein ACEPAF_562 [Sanghuangporus sanghuang]